MLHRGKHWNTEICMILSLCNALPAHAATLPLYQQAQKLAMHAGPLRFDTRIWGTLLFLHLVHMPSCFDLENAPNHSLVNWMRCVLDNVDE